MMTGLAQLEAVRLVADPQRRRAAGRGFRPRKARPATSTPSTATSRWRARRWDTPLLFFFGVIMCVGALGYRGYLALLSHQFYGGLGATTANVLVGLLSAVLDNIPMMVAGADGAVDGPRAVAAGHLHRGRRRQPAVDQFGRGRGADGAGAGRYTFFSHLKWRWAIALGYAAGIGLHLLVNAPFHRRAVNRAA